MSATVAQAKVMPISEREERVEEIQRRAQQWRLLDCSESTLRQMRLAVSKEMAKVEERLEEADERFLQYVEVGNPSGTEQTLEAINRLSDEWERLKKRLGEIDDVLHEHHLRSRLVGFLGSERRLNALEVAVFISILVVVVMTLGEMLIPNLPLTVIETITVVDTIICFFLLGDFFLRMGLSDNR